MNASRTVIHEIALLHCRVRGLNLSVRFVNNTRLIGSGLCGLGYDAASGKCDIARLGSRRQGGHVRTVPVPPWVRATIHTWTTAAGVTHGAVFRAINQTGRISTSPGRLDSDAERCLGRKERLQCAVNDCLGKKPGVAT
jgi:hypothetical protein